jgi:hypothetical protein
VHPAGVADGVLGRRVAVQPAASKCACSVCEDKKNAVTIWRSLAAEGSSNMTESGRPRGYVVGQRAESYGGGGSL